MLEKFLKNMEKSQSPLMTDLEYQEFLKKQKLDDIKEIIAGVGFGMLWILLLFIASIF